MPDKTDSKEREAPDYGQLAAIYKQANGEDVGKAQPLTTKRIINAMRAAFQAGRASLAASAGSEPVAHLWQHSETGRTRVVMPDMVVDACATWLLVGPLYLHTSPPEGMVGGWIASKDQMPPPGVRVFWGDANSNRVGYDSWAGDDYRWAPSHWMHIPEFPAPPTTSAGCGKGE